MIWFRNKKCNEKFLEILENFEKIDAGAQSIKPNPQSVFGHLK